MPVTMKPADPGIRLNRFLARAGHGSRRAVEEIVVAGRVAINGEVVATAWLGFPVAYIFAMCCDWFVASPLAKGFAFKYLVTPGKSSPLAMTLAVSSCMVVPMVIIMSLYGACEGLTHMPGGILANLYSVPAIWMINIPHNFVMALPWNLLVAGPISRFVFRRAFPVGTVFEEEHAELLEQAMAPECE